MRVEGLAGTTILRTMSGCGGLPRSVGDASSSLVISPEQLSECDWNPFASLEQHLDLYVPTIFSPYAHGGRENLWIGSSNGHPDKQVLGVEVSGDGKKDMPPPVLPEDDSRARGSLDRTGSLLSDEELGRGKRPKGKKRGRMPELGALDPVSCNRIQNMAVERKDDVEKDVREHSPGNSAQKLTSEQAKGNSSSGDDQKEGSANTRAKRGHATNSHSLAERVRREKISQRMKFLQDLVPGCSKITGKAVMLDEIINYVQSLQQQVEFLSMKLATVDPEMQFRTGRDLSPDVIYPQAGNPGVPVIGGGANYSHFHVQGANQHGAWQGQMSAGVWNANLRSSKNVSLNSNAHIDATNQSLGERHGGPL